MRHSAYKREKYTFNCVSMQVINTPLNINFSFIWIGTLQYVHITRAITRARVLLSFLYPWCCVVTMLVSTLTLTLKQYSSACPGDDPDPTFYWHPSTPLSSKYQSLTLTIASFVCGMSEIIPSVNIRSTKYLDGNTNFRKHKQSVVVWNILAKRNSNNQAPVVLKVDNAIHRINHYPVNRAIGFPNTYPLDSDLSGG